MAKRIFKSIIAVGAISALATAMAATAFASSYSSVDKNYVTSVKSQGNWGVCWAFGSISAIETSLIREHNLNNSDNTDLSENLTAYYTFYPSLYGNIGSSNDKLNNNFALGTDYLEAGNNPQAVADIMMNWIGPFDENENYPYNTSAAPSIAQDQLTEEEYYDIIESSQYHLTDYDLVYSSDPYYIEKGKRVIDTYGAAAVLYYESAGTDASAVSGGNVSGKFINYSDGEYYTYCYDSTYGTNHIVTIVGYDDSIPKEKFSKDGYTPADDGAWLIKGTWGSDVYKNGYYWMSYYDYSLFSLVGFDLATFYDKDYYDNIYSYDGVPFSVWYNIGQSVVYNANVFTAEKNEVVTGGSYYVANGGRQHDVSLYVNLTDETDPESGTLVDTVHSDYDGYGYFSVEFPRTEIAKGQKFAIVVKETANSDENADIPCELTADRSDLFGDGDVIASNTISAGQSFIRGENTTWSDAVDLGLPNIKIKAYTNDAGSCPVENFKSVNVKDTSFRFEWDEATGADGYEISLYNTASGNLLVNRTLDTDKPYFEITGAEPETSYTAIVRTINTVNGETVYSDYEILEVMTTEKIPLVAPVVTVTTDGKSAHLSWEAVQGATSYEVLQYKNSAFTTLATVSSTSVTLNNLTYATQYTFYIRAVDADGNTAVSDAVVFTPLEVPVVTATPGDGQVTLKWNAVEGAAYYMIMRENNGSYSVLATDITATSVIVKNLTNGVEYTYYVVAVAEDESVTASDAVYVTPSAPSVSAVTGLKIGGRASDALRLNWTKNADAEGYIIEQYNGSQWSRITKITNNATTTYRIAGLDASTTYKFRIRAYKMTGDSSAVYSDYANVTGTTVPSTVSGLVIGGKASDALRLNWTKNTSADGYIIEKYDGSQWVRITKITNNATTTYRVAGLTAGTSYKFSIRAYNMVGSVALYSGYSNVTGTTNLSPVSGLEIGARVSDAIRLNWTKNAYADGYIIEKYDGSQWTRITKITSNATTTYRVSGLDASVTYKFRICAYKMTGASSAIYSVYSNVTGTTNPSPVSGLKIGGKASDALRLNWTKNTSADGYIIEMYYGDDWVRISKITDNSTITLRKSGLASGETYMFRVRAYNMVGSVALYSEYSYVSGTTN